MNERALVKILDPLSTACERFEARVVTWAEPYLTLRLQQPILVPTVVQVRFHGRIALGEIQECFEAGGEFEIRVQFQDVMSMR